MDGKNREEDLSDSCKPESRPSELPLTEGLPINRYRCVSETGQPVVSPTSYGQTIQIHGTSHEGGSTLTSGENGTISGATAVGANPTCFPEVHQEQKDRYEQLRASTSPIDIPQKMPRNLELSPKSSPRQKGAYGQFPLSPQEGIGYGSPPVFCPKAPVTASPLNLTLEGSGLVTNKARFLTPLSAAFPDFTRGNETLLECLENLNEKVNSLSAQDSSRSNTKVMLDRVEQLVKEKAELQYQNMCLQRKIGQMNDYIATLLSEREEYSTKCESLENRLNFIEQRNSNDDENLVNHVAKIKQAQQMSEYWQSQYQAVEQVKSVLHQQVLTLRGASQSITSLDQVEVVDNPKEAPETPQEAQSPTKNFVVERIHELIECKLCLQHVDRGQIDEDTCLFHPTRPLNFDEWKNMLPHEAQDVNKRRHKLYYCCWKLASKRPIGCVGPTRHITNT